MKAAFWRTKLDEVNDTIKALMDRHVRLKEDYNKLSDKYSTTKACVLDSVWRYIPQHCIAFENIPKLDTQLVETSLNVGQWNIFDNLGSGQFSVVKRCRRSACTGRDADKEYAIKMICKDKYRTVDSIFRAENEVKALTVLGCHPNILSAEHILHGLIGLYVVTEIMPMDLFDFTEKFKYHLNDKLVGYIVSQLLAGLDHLWQSDIVHRDLKPENILADFSGADLRIKLCDFGLSTPFQGGDTLRDFCGSPGFYAPECTTHNAYCGRKADLFSLGAIVLELLSGATYFRDEWLSAYRLVKSGNATHFRNEIKNSIDAAQRLVNGRYPPDIARAATSMINYTAVMRPEIHFLRQRNNWICHSGSAANKLDVLVHLNAGDKAVIHHFDRVPRGATKKTANLRKKPALPNIVSKGV